MNIANNSLDFVIKKIMDNTPNEVIKASIKNLIHEICNAVYTDDEGNKIYPKERMVAIVEKFIEKMLNSIEEIDIQKSLSEKINNNINKINDSDIRFLLLKRFVNEDMFKQKLKEHIQKEQQKQEQEQQSGGEGGQTTPVPVPVPVPGQSIFNIGNTLKKLEQNAPSFIEEKKKVENSYLIKAIFDELHKGTNTNEKEINKEISDKIVEIFSAHLNSKRGNDMIVKNVNNILQKHVDFLSTDQEIKEHLMNSIIKQNDIINESINKTNEPIDTTVENIIEELKKYIEKNDANKDSNNVTGGKRILKKTKKNRHIMKKHKTKKSKKMIPKNNMKQRKTK
jgi:hypothetical protein